MSVNRWRGDQVAISQQNTITVGGTMAAGQVYTVTINGKAVSYTAILGDTNTTIAGFLTANLSASTIAEFAEMSWANPAAAPLTITGTAQAPGNPITQTSSATGTGMLVTVVTTANASPNDWSAAANWSLGAVPVNGDDVYFDNSSVGVYYGLAQSAVTLASLNITASYTGTIGLPDYSVAGSYYEYRAKYLAIGATACTVGLGIGAGSGRLKIDFGSVQTGCTVYTTSTPSDAGLEALLVKGTHASNAINVYRGTVGIATEAGAVSTFLNVRVGFETAPLTDVTIRIGSGVTLGTLNQSGGTVTVNGSATTAKIEAGNLIIVGSGTIGTLTVLGGSVSYQSSGSITVTMTVAGNGSVDFTRDMRAKTIAAANLYAGCSVKDSYGVCVFTTGFTLVDCRLSDIGLDLGPSRVFTVT